MKNNPSKKTVYPNLTAFSIILGIFMLFGVVIRWNFLEPETLKLNDRLSDINAHAEANTATIPVKVGFYVENNYAITTDTKIFDSDGWIWLVWPQAAQDIFVSKDLPPEKWINFVNLVQDWDFNLSAVYPTPVFRQDGQYYQLYKYSGHFYINQLDFHKFPFHTLTLPIVLEINEFHQDSQNKAISLVADEAASGVGAYIDIMGYETKDYRITSRIHAFGSNFGRDGFAGNHLQTRQVALEVSYRQSVNASLLHYFLPLMTVMALTLFAPMLSASFWEVRLSIPPTALLTLIFLQQTYKDTLPNLPYLTYIDVVYNTCYLTNVMLFGLFLWGSNDLECASELERPAVIAKIDAIDRKIQLAIVLFLFITLIANWFEIKRYA